MGKPCATLLVTVGHSPVPVLAHPRARGVLQAVDLYELGKIALDNFCALWIGMHSDQRYLSTHLRERLERFVRQGGRLVVCGQVAYPFLTGLERFTLLPDYRAEDLRVHRLAEHPVWRGVSTEDLIYRRGVAGFYGRGWHRPPESALVIHGLGPDRLPLDFEYRLGAGLVLVHGGNDLWGYGEDGGTAGRILPQLLDWGEGVEETE